MIAINHSGVPENSERLAIIESGNHLQNVNAIAAFLKQDNVVLLQKVTPEQADMVVHAVAGIFGLSETLELQAAFAGMLGHRHNIGKYFMSVNNRTDYQFISPHSEGNSSIRMQLASFFCYENSTDGGETIAMNVDSSSNAWISLREQVRRGKLGPRPLSQRDIIRARGLYQLNLPVDVLHENDDILKESPTEIPGLTLVETLVQPQKTYSRILDREYFAYWDSIASIDFDSAREYANLLKQNGLLKEPDGNLEFYQMDNAASRRVWHSSVSYAQLFRCKITRKLTSGDLLLQNNVTWTHSTSNWSPRSGNRRVAASFA